MGSIWNGGKLSLSIFGQSHGEAIGMTLDGIPSGIKIDMDEIKAFLSRRAPGKHPWSSPRREDDEPEFISGLVNGVTCGAPITAIIRNKNANSADYKDLANIPRPSHADFGAYMKHGEFWDSAGGGHFSGRLSAALCIAGGICLQILEKRGIYIGANICSIGNVQDLLPDGFDIDEKALRRLSKMDFPVFNPENAELMKLEIESAFKEQDSVGGSIGCIAIGVPPGLGEPMFGGVENRISQLIFAIPAVKGIEFGTGFEAAAMRGSEHNDPFFWDVSSDEPVIRTRTNNHGGILGGITSGMPITFRVAIKPTPSIGKKQESVYLDRVESATLEVRGRHDPCIVPRAVPCVEAVTAIAICSYLV